MSTVKNNYQAKTQLLLKEENSCRGQSVAIHIIRTI